MLVEHVIYHILAALLLISSLSGNTIPQFSLSSTLCTCCTSRRLNLRLANTDKAIVHTSNFGRPSTWQQSKPRSPLYSYHRLHLYIILKTTVQDNNRFRNSRYLFKIASCSCSCLSQPCRNPIPSTNHVDQDSAASWSSFNLRVSADQFRPNEKPHSFNSNFCP